MVEWGLPDGGADGIVILLMVVSWGGDGVIVTVAITSKMLKWNKLWPWI